MMARPNGIQFKCWISRRAATAADLAEAKDFVEELAARSAG